jgi:hypothetical protein
VKRQNGSACHSVRALAVIGSRRLYFEAIPSQFRVRITMAAAETTEALGSVIKFDTDEPGLRVCAPLEVEWATVNAEEIVAEAIRVWETITRHCDG